MRCDEFEELIWEHARTGTELPPEMARHAESCANCGRALRDARRIAPAMLAAGEVAASPNCRSAVMARISTGSRRWATGWAYACAVILVAGLVTTGIIAYRPHSPTVPTAPVVKNTTPSPVPAPPIMAEKTPEPKRIAPAPSAPVRVHHRTFARRHTPRRPATMMAQSEVIAPAPNSQPLHPELVEGPNPRPQPRAVAAVYASWPEAGTESSNESYSYVERDCETGETTKGSVKRSGNKVEIYIESTPGGEKPPVKGSIEHESKSNV